MTAYKQGEIILIPFPFTDLSTFKQRPAVILSSDEFNSKQRDVIAAAVTSRIPDQPEPSDFLLDASDLESARLPKASLVKLGKILTLDQRLIRKKLGFLPAATLTRLLDEFQHVLRSPLSNR